MPKQALSQVGVRALKSPPCGQVTYWDTNSPLGVRVSQGGSKTFIVMVRSGERRTIGRVGIIQLSDARSEAKRLIAQKTLGLLEPRAVLKFGDARELFIEQHYLDKRPRSKKEAKRLLEKHFAKLDNRPLGDVTDGHIGKELDKLAKTPGEQLHAFRVGRTFFRWCTRPPRRYIKHSPLEGYEPPGKDGKNERVLSQDELKKVWRAARGPFGAIVRLLILSVLSTLRSPKPYRVSRFD